MANHSTLVDLIGSVYDAAVEPSQWVPTLHRMADYLDADHGGLMGFSWAAKELDLWEVTGVGGEPFYREMYRTKYVRNPLADPAMALPVGLTFVSDSLIKLQSFRRTDYFQEFLRPLGWAHQVQAALAGNRDFLAGALFFRDARRGPFGAAEMERLQALIPHLQRALQLQARVEGWDPLRGGALTALDQLALGVVLLARDGSVLFMNEAAARIVERCDGMSVDNGHVRLADPSAAARLRDLIADARMPGLSAQSGGGAIAVPRSGRLPLQLLVAPLVGKARAILPEGRVALFLRDPERTVQPRPQWLIDLYGLTPAEARVAIAIVEGPGTAHAAATLGIGVNTLKTHLAHVFAKTGTRNQAELAALAGNIFGVI